MVKTPKVSIIIPAYNAGKFLHILLDSLNKQTINDFQTIIVDDGSTDNTSSLVKKLSCSLAYPIRLIQQENKGVSAARNAGLEQSEGEFVIFIDSDDYVAPTFIEKLINRQSETGANFIYCGFNRESKNGTTALPTQFIEGNILLQRINRELLFHTGGALINKAFLINNNIKFNTQLRLGEDLLFVYTILSKCNAFAVPEYLYYQTYQKSSVMNSNWSLSNYEHNAAAMAFIADNLNMLSESLTSKEKYDVSVLLKRSVLSSKIKLIWFLLSKKQFSSALSKLNEGFFNDTDDALLTLNRKDLKKYSIINAKNITIWRLYFFFKKKN